MTLTLTPNIQDPDTFYAAWLILVLANHIGGQTELSQALQAAMASDQTERDTQR